jgi:hypothetical protein
MGLIPVYRRHGNKVVLAGHIALGAATLEAELHERALANATEEQDDFELPARLAAKIQRERKRLNDWWLGYPEFERNWKNWRRARYHRIYAA